MKRENSLLISIAVLLCATLLTGSTSRQTASPPTQIAPVKANSAQAVPPEPLKARAVDPAPGQTVTDSAGLAPVPGANPSEGRSGEYCPRDSMFAQSPTDPNDSWSCATSAIATSFEYLVHENFWDLPCEILAIDWWGLSLRYDSGWYACDPEGVTFDIIFYEDDGGAPGDAVCSYTGLTPTVTATDVEYSGYEMYYFEIFSLDPQRYLSEGWVSIQSQMNDDDCAFLWTSSPDGDGDSLQNGASTYYDRAMCLQGYTCQYGACCDDYTGVCKDSIHIMDCDAEFIGCALCADLVPPCGILGACCVDLVCTATTYEVDCDGDWYEDETCPEFECAPTDADFIVTAPFTSEILSACDGDDCALRPYREHEYEVIIPHAGTWNFNTCLNSEWDTYIFLGTTLCSQDLGYNDDSCALQSEIEVDLEPGNYFCTIEGYDTCGNYVFDVYDASPFGACCYTFGEDIRCANNRERECDALDGDWYADEDCCTFRCPEWSCLEMQIDITILTDSRASETSWEVTDHVTGELVYSGGDYKNETWYYERCCILYTDCVDFTIYDAYGDGIIEPGGYIVALDGVEIANTMGGEFDSMEETLEFLGGGCMPCAGACCVEMVCVANNSWAACDALGGTWYMCESCPEFTCPFEYCTPCYSDSDDDYITNVTFSTINNDTGPEGAPCSYGDYTNIATAVEPEETYHLSVSLDGNESWTQYVSVWFDWDENTTFETAYELGSVVITPGTPVTITGDITIPADAGFGVKRMRVMQRYYQSTVDPCEAYAYGEAEDYTLVVVSGVCGDLDYDADVDTDDYYIFLDTFGTCAGDTKYNPAADFDGDQCITLVDYQMWMDCYSAANGKRL